MAWQGVRMACIEALSPAVGLRVSGLGRAEGLRV